MGYTASTETLEHIARLVEQERPEWEPAMVRIVLHNLTAYVDGSDLAIAALRVAQNHDVHTPKAIGWRGAHWRDLDSTPPDVTRHQRCGVCGKREPACVLERPGKDDDHAFEPELVTR